MKNSTSEGRTASANERVIAGQSKALELAVKGAPIGEVLDVLVHTIEEQSSNNVLGSVLLLDEEGKHLLHGAAPSLPKAYNDAIHGISIGEGIGSCGTAAYTGKTVIVQDIQTDPYWKDFKGLAGQHGLRACWSMPIKSSTGQVLGTFALYHGAITEPSERDQEIVELLAHTAAIVIERNLEVTRRRRLEEMLIRAQETMLLDFQAMFEHAPIALASVKGPENRFTAANMRFREIAGNKSLVGMRFSDVLSESSVEGMQDLLEEVRSTSKASVGRMRSLAMMNGDAAPTLEFVCQPIPDSTGKVDTIFMIAKE